MTGGECGPLTPDAILKSLRLMLLEHRMAGNLHVQNLVDDLIARLRRRAAPHGRPTGGCESGNPLSAEANWCDMHPHRPG
jgi:hypothetical protein